jgi:hypothetical protein
MPGQNAKRISSMAPLNTLSPAGHHASAPNDVIE